MAIVNVTPDSFADGGERFDPDIAIADAIRFVGEGADLIDIGGESTRPGAAPLGEDEELRRVTPVLEGLRGRVDVPVSIDTYKAAVAERALGLGAEIVNDVSAFAYEPALAAVVARRQAAVILMHHRGRSSAMYASANYREVAEDVATELAARDAVARDAGIAADRIILDPGLGFSKRAEHTFAAIAGLPRLAALGRPILVGPSRKSFLEAAIGDVPASQRDFATAAAVTACVLFGAHIIRIHNVAAMVQVAR